MYLFVYTQNKPSFAKRSGKKLKREEKRSRRSEERIQDMAERLPTYWGRVKNFDNFRGLGFIECEETKEADVEFGGWGVWRERWFLSKSDVVRGWWEFGGG